MNILTQHQVEHKQDEVSTEKTGAAPPADVFPRPFRFRRILIPLIIALAALIMIPWTDHTYHPIYHFLRHLPLARFFATTQQWATAPSIFLICLTIWFLDRRRRPTLVVFLVAISLGGLINGGIKSVTGRARPTYSLQMKDSTRQWINGYVKKHPEARMRPEARDQWLWIGHYSFNKDGYQSFPSGHANSAFIMVAYLSLAYPPARVVWYAAAVGCAGARVAGRRHFPDDVLFGGALGWIIAQWVFSWSWPMRVGNRYFGRKSESGIQNSEEGRRL